MSKIKLIKGPWDGYEFDAGILDNVHCIDIDFKEFVYRYNFVAGKFIFSDHDYRYSKRSKRFENGMVDCPTCGELTIKENIAKLKCGSCIYKLIKSGDIIES